MDTWCTAEHGTTDGAGETKTLDAHGDTPEEQGPRVQGDVDEDGAEHEDAARAGAAVAAAREPRPEASGRIGSCVGETRSATTVLEAIGV